VPQQGWQGIFQSPLKTARQAGLPIPANGPFQGPLKTIQQAGVPAAIGGLFQPRPQLPHINRSTGRPRFAGEQQAAPVIRQAAPRAYAPPQSQPVAFSGGDRAAFSGGGRAAYEPAPARVRPGDPAPGIGIRSAPMATMGTDRAFRHAAAQYGDGVAPPLTGEQRLADQIRSDAIQTGDLAGTDLGSALSSYSNEMADKMDPGGYWARGGANWKQGFGGGFGAIDEAYGRTNAGSPRGAALEDDSGDIGAPGYSRSGLEANVNAGSPRGAALFDDAGDIGAPGFNRNGFASEASDAGDVGVPTGTVYDGKRWNGRSWDDAAPGGNAAGFSKGFDGVNTGAFAVKPMSGSPWAVDEEEANRRLNAFAGLG